MSENIGRNIFDMPKKETKSESETGDEQKPNPRRSLIRWIPLAVIAVVLLAPMITRTLSSSGATTVEYSDFKQQLSQGVIERVEIGSEYLVGAGTAATGDEFLLRTVKVDDTKLLELLDERGIDYYAVPDRSNGFLASILSWILPFGPDRKVDLDSIGLSVLDLCDARRSVEKIIEIFAADNKLTFREAQLPVTRFLRQLTQRGIIAIVGKNKD